MCAYENNKFLLKSSYKWMTLGFSRRIYGKSAGEQRFEFKINGWVLVDYMFLNMKLFKWGRGMFIIIWFRHLPQISMDLSEWTPFIQNNWHRKHYMKFVYVLQIIIFLIPYYFGADFTHINIFYLIIIGICVFIIHEFLHVIVIKKKGDISLTCSGIFFG